LAALVEALPGQGGCRCVVGRYRLFLGDSDRGGRRRCGRDRTYGLAHIAVNVDFNPAIAIPSLRSLIGGHRVGFAAALDLNTVGG